MLRSANKTKSKESKSQTLEKAIRILDAFSLENPSWGIRELGRSLDMNPTTIYRIVATLNSAGFLEKDPETQRYTLGPKFIRLAETYSRLNPLTSVAQKIFEKYADQFEYNFYLGKLNNFEVVYLSVLDGRGPIKIVVEPGGSTTLHSTALGKVLLAFQDESFINAFLLNVPLIAFTPRTITDPAKLRSHLQQIRTQQYAINDGEHYEAIGAVGVPVISRSGKVNLGISLAYPRHLILDENYSIDSLIKLAKEITNEFSLHVDSISTS